MRWPWLAGLIAVGLAAVSPALGQDDLPPCSSAAAPATFTVVDSGFSSLYATHALHLKPSQQGEEPPFVRSASAPGARVLTDDGDTAPVLVSDNPGPLTVSAVLHAIDSDGKACRADATTTVQLLSPARSKVSKLKRPGYLVRKRRLYKPNPTFSFTVKPDKAAPDRRPFTVTARVSHRLRLPGKGAKVRTKAYPQRRFEIGEPQSLKFCQGELLCPRRTKRGWAKEVELDVRPHIDDGAATKGIKVIAKSPAGYPADRALKFFQTPWGLDLQVFQAGHRLARLRVVARCSGGGQSSRCSFKKVLLAR
jgi:hypothetical protein